MQNNNQPLVGIVVPVYNGADYIEECLESILAQEYKNWECIINDNKSEDKTVEIAQRFVDKDSRFRININEKAVPQTPNWNIAYSQISKDAKYFKLIPHDDWIYPEYLTEFVRVFEENPSVGICSSYRIDNNDVSCSGLDYYSGEKQNGKEMLVLHLKQFIELTGSINTVMYRVETLKKLPFHPEIFKPDVYHIDTFLAYDMMDISDLGFVYKVLSYTRRHNETYTSKISNRFRTLYYFIDVNIRRFLDKYPELEESYVYNRKNYAYFMFKKSFNDKECVEWHKKLNPKPITKGEMFKAALTKNIFARQLQKIL